MQVRWNSFRGRLAIFSFAQLWTTSHNIQLNFKQLQLTFAPFFSTQTTPTNTNCVHARGTVHVRILS